MWNSGTELGHQTTAGPIEGLCLMILAAGMFVQEFEAVVEIAYQFKAYIDQGALKHSVKRRAGVFSHLPAGGIVAVFGENCRAGLRVSPVGRSSVRLAASGVFQATAEI